MIHCAQILHCALGSALLHVRRAAPHTPVGVYTCWSRQEAAGATAPLVAATRADDRRDSAADGEEVVHDAHDALRGQKTPPPGVRPGSLGDPGPQRSDRTVRRSSGDSLPTLALPVLAGSAGEVVDSSSLRFFTASALKARREEEEKEKKKEKEKMEKRSAVHVEAAVALERARLLLERVSCWSRRARGGRERRGGRGGRLGPPPAPLFAVLVVDHGGGTLQAGFLQFFSSRCVLGCRWQARDAWHQGRFGPEEQLRTFS